MSGGSGLTVGRPDPRLPGLGVQRGSPLWGDDEVTRRTRQPSGAHSGHMRILAGWYPDLLADALTDLLIRGDEATEEPASVLGRH